MFCLILHVLLLKLSHNNFEDAFQTIETERKLSLLTCCFI